MPDKTCQHVWIYDHKDYWKLYMRCTKCGKVRVSAPGESAAWTAKMLRIRHDGEDGDV